MVEESINLQVLHWPTPQGKVPQGDDNSWGRLLWTRVSRIFLLCRNFARNVDFSFIVSGSERTFTFRVSLNTLPTLATLVRDI